ncbi:MAG: right-handed parallel beta-helix repeat-containing protein [Clostridiales bacterium]|nr:right-handed parallel beta-helix repeat-containing protein [Clostridiales bacterium]
MSTLLTLTVSGSVLTLLLVVLRYTLLRKMPSTVYYYAWLLVLLRFAVPLPGLVPTTAEKAEPMPKAPAAYVRIEDQENNDRVTKFVQNDPEKSRSTGIAETTASHIALNATEPREATVSENTPAPKASLSINWRSPKLWLSIWAIGAVISLGITVISYLRFSFGLKRNLMEPDSFTKSVYASIPGRKPALYFSDSARTPMMLGILNPKIVLPMREYNEELLLNILRHELTHYRRFDMIYKWVTAIVLALHWFNPVAWFIRMELNRACEMSCDEMLLRSMNKDEKQSYGNTLLLMAASTALPSAVVATTFATEKRNLKERLEQIMHYKKSGTRILATALAVTLLTGCGVAAGPVSERAQEAQAGATVYAEDQNAETTASASANDSGAKASEPKTEAKVVKVNNIEEFLAAIAPNTVIELAEGTYDLSKAYNYAKESKSKYYMWASDAAIGTNEAELVINNVINLTIRGAGIGKTTIAAVPRYANVIVFKNCKEITVSNLTAGHTKEPGFCTGGVILVDDSSDVNVDSCGLFGCGTEGVRGISSKKINVTNCDIYECSIGAVTAAYCEDVLVSGCDIHDHGTKKVDEPAYRLFDVDECVNFTVYNCKIHDNKAEGLLYTANSYNVLFLSNEVTNNTLKQSTSYFELIGARVDGCHFDKNYTTGWYVDGARIKATNVEGKELDTADFTAMKLRDIKPETVTPQEAPPPVPTMKAKEVAPGTEITVKTVDEFLEAIGPDRTIILDGTNFKLTTATYYGKSETDYYNWCSTPDGPQLMIYRAKNLTIKAKNPDPAATVFEAVPRYADVLSFVSCDNLTVSGFTAGHTKGDGECGGGVLSFENCTGVKVEKMRLYGCGVNGVETNSCYDINIVNTEIYECSSEAGWFTQTNGIHFVDCNIHDVPSPALVFYGCSDNTWNGQRMDPLKWRFDVKPDGTIVGLENPKPHEDTPAPDQGVG